MIVMAVIVAGMIVMRLRSMGIGSVRVGAMGAIMMLDDVAARMACMGAENRDQPRKDSADQRQKDDCLDHGSASPSSD
jgi:hypothetical protein